MAQRRKGKDPWVCTECGARTFGAWSKPVPEQAALGAKGAKRAQMVLNDPSTLRWPVSYQKAVSLLEASGAVKVRHIEEGEIVLSSVERELLCRPCYDDATLPLFGPPTKTELKRRRRSTLPVSRLPERTHRDGRARSASGPAPGPMVALAALSREDDCTLITWVDEKSALRVLANYTDEPEVLLAEAEPFSMYVLAGGILFPHGLGEPDVWQPPSRKATHVTLFRNPDRGEMPTAHVLDKLGFVRAVAADWSGAGALYDEVTRDRVIRWGQSGAVLGRPPLRIDGKRAKRVVECLANASRAEADRQREETARKERARRRQEASHQFSLGAEARMAARLREEAFQRELRDRQQRDDLVSGAIMILGGIVGAKKW